MTGNSDEYVPTCLTRRNSLWSRETSPEKRDVVDMWFDLVLQSGYHAGEIAVVVNTSNGLDHCSFSYTHVILKCS